MQTRFYGSVKLLKGSWGFIDRCSVRCADTGDYDFSHETDEDIFFRTADFPDAKLGGVLLFYTETDPKRGNGKFRATPVKFVPIELHFPEHLIDHPTVPVRWCLTPMARHLIVQNPDDTWYLAIVAQPRPQEHEVNYTHKPGTTIAAWVGLKRIGDGYGFIDLRRSGCHDIVVYLISSTSGEKSLKRHFDRYERPDKIDVWGDTDRTELSIKSSDLPFLTRGVSSRTDQVRGQAHSVIDVPEEIFAKPPSGYTKRMLEYFKVGKLRDQCDGRRVIPLVCIGGPFLLVAWELLKRVWMFLLGVLHFSLAGGSALPLWRRAFSSNLSAQISDWKGSLEYEPLTEWSDRNLWYHPLPLTLLGVPIVWALLASPESRGLPIGILVAVVFTITAFLAIALFGEGVLSAGKRFYRQRTEHRAQTVLDRIEHYASCDHITAAPVPPTTIRLVFSNIKRLVCRNYAS
jgi:hypothetical protein